MRGTDIDITRLKAELGCKNVDQLLILTRMVDPFYVEEPGQIAKADWFKGVFERYQAALKEQGKTTPPHLRGMHYWLQALKTVNKDDGASYENTKACWTYLQAAGKYARYLETVDPNDFVDQRNPKPVLNAIGGKERITECYASSGGDWELPSISVYVHEGSAGLPGLSFNYSTSYGRSAAARAAQPYLIEVWCEKSTMDEILQPLCSQYGVNYVAFSGNASITAGVELMERIRQLGKPARILYVSDADKEGKHMPEQVARYIEFWRWKWGIETEVKLDHIALTDEQIEEHELPKSPISNEVELDALEAIKPGVLEGIVHDAINQYRDKGLYERYQDYFAQAEKARDDVWNELVAQPYRERRDTLMSRINGVLAPYQEDATELQDRLRDELATELEQFGGELASLRSEVIKAARAAAIKVEIPDTPEPVKPDTDRDDILYDSSRTYFEQLKHNGSAFSRVKRRGPRANHG